jgi:ABC-type multidrug transport system permease subunit
MRLLIASLKKEIRRVSRDPFAFVLWLGIPFSILLLMNLAFGGRSSSGPRPQGVILIADLDGTLLSGALNGAFSQGPLGDMFKPEKTTEADGRQRMGKGEASALIIVPKGFQDALLNNRPAAIQFVKNPSQRILPAIAGESLNMLSEAVHYLHLVAGDDIKMIAGRTSAPSDADVVKTSLAINSTIKRLSASLDPLLLDLEIKQPPKQDARPSFNFFAATFPGIVFVSLLFIGRGTSDDLWDELRFATLRRTQSAGLPLLTLVAGKLLVTMLVASLVSILALGLGQLLAGVPVVNWPAAIAWMIAGGAVWYLIMLILQTLAGARNRGEMLTSFVIFPSMMLGGSMFAFDIMPDSLARIGKLTPLGWMVTRFTSILRGAATASDVLVWLGIMAAVTAVLFLLSARLLRWRFLRG